MTDFPTLFDWIERFDFLRGMPAAYLTLLAALIVVTLWDWRLSVLALTVHYLLAGLLFVEVLEPRLAIVKVLVGLFVSLMLYFSGRQAGETVPRPAWEWRRLLRPRSLPWGTLLDALRPGNFLFRLLLALVLLLVLLSLAGRPGNQLPALPPAVNLAVFGLSGLGLLGLSLTPNPLRAGMGLLLVMSGFELFYNSLEQSVTMLVALAIVNLAITLGIAYLAQSTRPLLVSADYE